MTLAAVLDAVPLQDGDALKVLRLCMLFSDATLQLLLLPLLPMLLLLPAAAPAALPAVNSPCSC